MTAQTHDRLPDSLSWPANVRLGVASVPLADAVSGAGRTRRALSTCMGSSFALITSSDLKLHGGLAPEPSLFGHRDLARI